MVGLDSESGCVVQDLPGCGKELVGATFVSSEYFTETREGRCPLAQFQEFLQLGRQVEQLIPWWGQHMVEMTVHIVEGRQGHA